MDSLLEQRAALVEQLIDNSFYPESVAVLSKAIEKVDEMIIEMIIKLTPKEKSGE